MLRAVQDTDVAEEKAEVLSGLALQQCKKLKNIDISITYFCL